MEEMNLKISASPHVRGKDTTSDIMFDVIIALVPASVIGIYQFGWYAALLIAVCMLTSVLTEFIYQKAMKLPVRVGDFSAALTGLFIALNLPPTLPVWMAMLGCVFAIIVVKQLFGGIGQNFMNPALGARCFLLLAFSKYMTNFTYDGVSTATPLAVLKSGGSVDLFKMFIGQTAGTIGEVSAAALLFGAAYLLIRKVISPKIPLVYIGTFAICIVIYAVVKDKDVVNFTLAHLCGGGLMLGAWFMATDYVTSPVTPNGKIIYGILLGLLTFVLRIFGSSAEGVSYAIIISNLFVPLIEKVTVPKCFGYGADVNKEEKKHQKKEAKQAKKSEADEIKETVNTELDKEGKTDGGIVKDASDNLSANADTSKKQINVKGILIAVASLFVITIVMGAALGVVYDITKKPIEEADEKAKQEAYLEVMPDAIRIQALTSEEIDYDMLNRYMGDLGYPSDTIDEISLGFDKEDSPTGFIFIVTNSEGYGGNIKMVIGVDFAGNVTGISFLDINETAGLGMEAKDKEFIEQFYGKATYPFSYTKTGSTADSEIDALSGATITTSAVTDGVNAALRLFIDLMEGMSE